MNDILYKVAIILADNGILMRDDLAADEVTLREKIEEVSIGMESIVYMSVLIEIENLLDIELTDDFLEDNVFKDVSSFLNKVNLLIIK